MKKCVMFISILFLSMAGLFAQEYIPIHMVLTEDTPAWDEDTSFRYSYNKCRVFPKDTVVQVMTGPCLGSLNSETDEYIYFCYVSLSSLLYQNR